jgi:acetolactate synthase regulatory subunit
MPQKEELLKRVLGVIREKTLVTLTMSLTVNNGLNSWKNACMEQLPLVV